jgi:hypothetical protein
MGKGQKRAPLRKPDDAKKTKTAKLSSSQQASTGTDDHSEEDENTSDVEKIVGHAQEDSSDSDSDSDNDDLMIDGDQGEIIDMAFDFNDMKEEYSYGIAKMLKHLNSNEPDAIKLAEVISQQEVVGTAVCCDEGSDVFAYATVLPMHTAKDDDNFGPIISDLLSACTKLASCDNKDAIISHINGEQVDTTGLFLHGRFMNLPLQLCGALHANLVDDLNWAKDNSSASNATSSSVSEEANAFKGIKHKYNIAALYTLITS